MVGAFVMAGAVVVAAVICWWLLNRLDDVDRD